MNIFYIGHNSATIGLSDSRPSAIESSCGDESFGGSNSECVVPQKMRILSSPATFRSGRVAACVWREETFDRRFRVPRSLFMRVYEAMCDRPFGRQSINATRRPRAHVLQKVVAAVCVVAYGWSYNRADEYVWLSNFTTDVATKKLIEVIAEECEPVYRRCPIEEEISPRRPGSPYFR